MDKSWIHLPNRTSGVFQNGLVKFLDFAFHDKPDGHVIYCPCKRCCNRYLVRREVAWEHITTTGFMRNYTTWINHGEPSVPLNVAQRNDDIADMDTVDDMVGMLHDAMGIPNVEVVERNEEATNENRTGPNEETIKFLKLLQDAERELYPGCLKFTCLSFIVRLLHIKVLSGWTDKSFTLLLELLKDAFPEGVALPRSYYEANKITTDLGFTNKTWDACPNNCMLFRNEFKGIDKCVVCQASRYKQVDGISSDDKNKGRKIAAKQVRYFPLKPRLQRLFMSSKTASLMRWHAEERVDDGVMRHPADSLAWKEFDERNTTFASDSRNVRLGLATDGFCPFKSMTHGYSIWPVVLMPYNLPPWLCMKQTNFILSVLIDGPKGPGDKIDVYLEPLIEELKELWNNGVLTYDASKNEMFTMRAGLLWTISDFPAYANLSGWSTKGKFACPSCNEDTRSNWLTNCKKYCYLGHRRFLPTQHKFRKDKLSFDNSREWKGKPHRLSGSELLHQLNLNDVLTEYKREDLIKRKFGHVVEVGPELRKHNWKKKSIFFELPYWEHNLIRHNLDVMHIEKNVCDNILYTLLGVANKSKDHLNARRDLVVMGIRESLHPQPKGTGKLYLPPACFTMSKTDTDVFCRVLKNVKVPDGYASNISRCVYLRERSIRGLKSHDSHILMQQLLPIATRRVLQKNVIQALIELTNFFRQLCSKVNRASDLEYIQDRIALVLCHLEKIFPPSFFDIMEHLPIHLAEEALIAGAVQFRWMYPIERYLYTLKKYVRNRAHPEGSIAAGYLMEECMNFCARYLNDVETKANRPSRNDDIDDKLGRPLGKVNYIPNFDDVTRIQAHRYVLLNTDSVSPFRMEHITFLKQQMPRASETQIWKRHNETFHEWFRNHVQDLRRNHGVTFSDEINRLADGPDISGLSYGIYIINGKRFRVKERDHYKTKQNSGVMVNVTAGNSNVSHQQNFWYGVLTDIIEIRYTNDMKFVLFKCDWVNNDGGKKVDEFNFTLVNLKKTLYKDNHILDEPFIFASQAEQVWYVEDPIDPDWHVVVRMAPRDYFDVYSDIHEVEPYCRQELDESLVTRPEDVVWVRQGTDGTIVDVAIAVGEEVELHESDED